MGRNSPYKEVYLWECKCPAASIHSQNLDLCNLPAWIENQNHKIVISIYQKISKQPQNRFYLLHMLYTYVLWSPPPPTPSPPIPVCMCFTLSLCVPQPSQYPGTVDSNLSSLSVTPILPHKCDPILPHKVYPNPLNIQVLSKKTLPH